jgi:hypothetical protein
MRREAVLDSTGIAAIALACVMLVATGAGAGRRQDPAMIGIDPSMAMPGRQGVGMFKKHQIDAEVIRQAAGRPRMTVAGRTSGATTTSCRVSRAGQGRGS